MLEWSNINPFAEDFVFANDISIFSLFALKLEFKILTAAKVLVLLLLFTTYPVICLS